MGAIRLVAGLRPDQATGRPRRSTVSLVQQLVALQASAGNAATAAVVQRIRTGGRTLDDEPEDQLPDSVAVGGASHTQSVPDNAELELEEWPSGRRPGRS